MGVTPWVKFLNGAHAVEVITTVTAPIGNQAQPVEETACCLKNEGPVTAGITGPLLVAGGGFEPPTFGL
jgi:hypothetical protein